MKYPRQMTVCHDGTSLSVQGSAGHLCIPRNDDGPYTHVEVGFISDVTGDPIVPIGWDEFARDAGSGRKYYAWLPTKLVIEFINEHGGVSTPLECDQEQRLLI